MIRRYIRDMQAGEAIEDQIFMIASKDLRQTTQGALYIHAVLMDRTGQLLARAWQANEAMYGLLPRGGFIRLKGRTESYKGNLQFIIEAIRPVDDPSIIDVSDFLPHTEKDIDEMWGRVCQILKQIKNEFVAGLIDCFVTDEELVRRFKTSPAAIALHHAYIGGLLEHTLAVLELAVQVIPRYPKVSLDLVLAGVFLHDIAKTSELTYDTHFAYSDAGQLVGHIAQAATWIELKSMATAKKLGKPFPADIRNVLQHIVLAHHGRYEFGSPKLPAIPEAIAVHYLDNLDAKLHMFAAAMEGEADQDSHWTTYNRALETKVFRPDVLGDRQAI